MRFASLLALAVFTLMIMGLSSVCAQQDNFVLIYTFDKDEGGVVKDLSGLGNDGAPLDTVWTANGKFGGGIEFNGTTSLIEVPHDPSLNPGGDQLSIMAWYKPLSFPAGHPPIARKGQAAAGVGCWGFDTPTGTPRGFVYMAADGTPKIAQATAVMTLGEWNHLAMTYNGAQLQVYVNGVMDISVDVTGDINENNDVPVWVSKKATEAIYLHGVMDELAILNVGLTADQVVSYMENGIAAATAVEASGKLASTWGTIKAR